MKIALGIAQTTLGQVAMGCMEDGAVCFLTFVASKDEALAQCQRHYPQAGIVFDAALDKKAAALVERWCRGEALDDVAIRVQGTPFRQRVWEELSRIPRGQTRSYAEVAAAIGSPRAMRAVGSACGANPVSLFVPCHRVLHSTGTLGGYAWGLPLKARILAMERREIRAEGLQQAA